MSTETTAPDERAKAPSAASAIEADPMWHRAYMDVQAILDRALGTEEEDGAGAGIAANVALLASQRDRARREAARLKERCADCRQPGQPCACSGTLCCVLEAREIAAATEAAAGERARADEAEAKLATIRDACRGIPSPIANRLLVIIDTGRDDRG